ncbi:hypothetical protein O6H91_05G072900 [Diphasiastrum complanatum]|uniref:Uncharacterized protein n=1 Tax=Diphasiastrum complanatum TaxID=34168 RepID=A0ACC2DPW4_DIPCM|nr:hypothetical protein O6H91_05G072900 [Diphasiastrum complanatum]
MAGSVGDENTASRYVKLVKEQDAPMEEIRPGELNQPVHVPQLVVHRCEECGQPLPESYELPRNEPWTTGICGCAEDTESCWQGVFCPCVLFGKNFESLKDDVPWTTPCTCHAIFVEGGIALALATAVLSGINPRAVLLIAEGLFFSWWMCAIYSGLFRQELQRKYHLKNTPCDPCMVHCCLHFCALCQEHREMRSRLSHDVVLPMIVINPPAVQQMQMPGSQASTNSDAAEIQAL